MWVSYHYKNPEKHFSLRRSGYHHLIQMCCVPANLYLRNCSLGVKQSLTRSLAKTGFLHFARNAIKFWMPCVSLVVLFGYSNILQQYNPIYFIMRNGINGVLFGECFLNWVLDIRVFALFIFIEN